MAKAEKTEVEVTTKVEGVTLYLSMDEVRALRAVGWKVGGSPEKSPRGKINAIMGAIDAATGKGGYDEDWIAEELKSIRNLRSAPGIYFDDID